MNGPGSALRDAVLLFRLTNPWLDGALTALTVAALAVSRFGLLPCGPWEWDETLFARGLLHFELAAHFPHPPGFPGWLAIGHLVLPLAGEPLRALQWASAGLSVATIWPLASLGRKVARPTVAVAAAVLLMVMPGPWLYSVRGFSSTPAAAFALAAAAVAVGGLRGRRATLFSILVAAAFLIRPILLPGLAALWIVGVAGVRPRRRLLPGVAAGLLMGLLSVLAMVRAEGGWSAFAGAFLAHSDKHFSRIAHSVGGWENVGLVKGLGGGGWTVVMAAVALLGLVRWRRAVGRRSAIAWVVVLAVAAGQLLTIQNRSYARYATPVQLALAPLVASAASLLPPAAAVGAVAAAAGWAGASAYPLLREQHRRPLPGWQAVQTASRLASDRQMAVVVEPELHPFASYQWHLLERAGAEPPPLVLSPWAPEPWAGVDRPYLVATVHRHHYHRPLVGGELEWGAVSARLVPFTQQRFLEAWVMDAPALPVGQWWPVEADPKGGLFLWGGASCELVLPPLPAGTVVEASLRPAPGPTPLEVLWNGVRWSQPCGEDDPCHVVIRPEQVRSEAANRLAFRRERGYPPGPMDSRPLAVQVRDLRVLGWSLPWRVDAASEPDLGRLGIRLEGSHAPESFEGAGLGVWLMPEARLLVPAVAGRLGLTLMAPRPTAPSTVIRVGGRELEASLDPGARPTLVWVPIRGSEADGEQVTVVISSEGFRPAPPGAGDSRWLGVVLTTIRFEPEAAPAWTRSLEDGAAGQWGIGAVGQ